MRVGLVVVVLCLVVVCRSSRRQERLCKKNLGLVESKCVEQGYQPPSDIACHFAVLTPNRGKKGRKSKLKFNKKRCTKAADYCVKNCPDYHCGTTSTSTSTPREVTTVPCPGGMTSSYGTTNPTGSLGDPCYPSVPTTPEGGWEK